MESSVRVTTSSNGTFDDLPYEVLQELFRYIPTKELISVWRLVSTNLSHFASEHCRQRSVRLRLPRPDEIFNAPISQLFLTNPPPFSAATLTLNSDSLECFAFSRHVAKRFGEHFKSAQVSTRLFNDTAFFETLRRTPNLVALEIRPMPDSEKEDFTYTYTVDKMKLAGLKSLKMVYAENSHFMRLLESCFRQLAPQLDFVDLQLNSGGISDADFKRCAELISSQNFPRMSLSLPFRSDCSDGWKLLVAKGPFEIQNLTVSSYDTEDVDMTFGLLGPFLANCQGLASLTLNGFEKRSLTSKRCRVPVMPTLRKLKLNEVFIGEGTLCRFQLGPFQARSLPSLTAVVVDCRAYCGDCEYAIDVRQIFDVGGEATERFLGVTALDVGSTRSATIWADIFPNVTKLRASIRNAKEFATIFTNMSQVTHLDLQLSKGIFFGLSQRIRSLKQLKTLTLRLNVLEDEIGMFAALPPLDLKMVYGKYELSDNCLSLLRNRHLSVELLMEDNGKKRLTN